MGDPERGCEEANADAADDTSQDSFTEALEKLRRFSVFQRRALCDSDVRVAPREVVVSTAEDSDFT
jgi:hypothetical protein